MVLANRNGQSMIHLEGRGGRGVWGGFTTAGALSGEEMLIRGSEGLRQTVRPPLFCCRRASTTSSCRRARDVCKDDNCAAGSLAARTQRCVRSHEGPGAQSSYTVLSDTWLILSSRGSSLLYVPKGKLRGP